MHYTEYDVRLAAYAAIVDDDRILLTWFNGEGSANPGWSLPGGGVEYEESLQDAVVRETYEETGYTVAVGRPLFTDHVIADWSTRSSRPYKALRVCFAATITGGELGTTEVGGSTDFCEWMPIDDIGEQASRARIIDLALQALNLAT